MRNSICDDMKTEPFKDVKNRHFHTDSSNDIPGLFGEQCKHPIRASDLDCQSAFRSLFSSSKCNRCTLAFQETVDNKLASLIFGVNQEKKTSTFIFLNQEMGSQERRSSFSSPLFQEGRLHSL